MKTSVKVEIWRDDKAREYPLPKVYSMGAIGYDLYCVEDCTVRPNEFMDVPTGIIIGAPRGVWFQILARSSMFKRGLIMPVGVIDSDYRGFCYAPVFNIGTKDQLITKGSRICQVVFFKSVGAIEWQEHDDVDDMSVTGRGSGGFGSTGK